MTFDRLITSINYYFIVYITLFLKAKNGEKEILLDIVVNPDSCGEKQETIKMLFNEQKNCKLFFLTDLKETAKGKNGIKRKNCSHRTSVGTNRFQKERSIES